MATLLDKQITARKIHKCCECNQDIIPGERYRRVVSVADYGLESAAFCTVCERLGSDLFSAGIEGEDPYSGSPCYPYLPDVDLEEVPEGDLQQRFIEWRQRAFGADRG